MCYNCLVFLFFSCFFIPPLVLILRPLLPEAPRPCLLLDEIKKYIDEQIETQLDKRENFMFRDYVDDVFFAIYFKDGSRDLQCKGMKAYEIFIKDDTAIRIETRTKELKPRNEVLMIKENGTEKYIPCPN